MIKTNLIQTRLKNAYVRQIKHLDVQTQLEIIAELSLALSLLASPKPSVDNFVGAWEDSKSADEIIEELRSSRHFNKQIEDF